MPLSKDAILSALERREAVVDCPALGGEVLIRELLRTEYMAAEAFAATGAVDPTTGAKLLDPWRWHAGLVAPALVDPASGEPYADGRRDPHTSQIPIDPSSRTALFTAEQIAAWPNRATLRDGLAELAQAVLDLSEPADPKPSPG